MAARSSVFVLLGGSPPFTVLWVIAAIVINALQGQSGWSFAHVGEEVFEFVPAFTHRDAAGAVVGPIFFPILVVAPREHSAPCAECGGWFSASGVTMSATVYSSGAGFEAAARFGIPRQISTSDIQLSPTIATAPPKNNGSTRRAPMTVGDSESSQPTITRAGSVDDFGHDRNMGEKSWLSQA